MVPSPIQAWRGRPTWTMTWAMTLALAACILCAAAFINGGPILYPDTLAYIADGDRLVRLAAPLNVRPVFYGLAIWFLHWDRTAWPVLLAQGLIVAHLVWLTLTALGAPQTRLGLLAVVAALAVFTPLSWYVSHILPDVFSGVLVLALFLLGVCRDRLGRGQTVYLVLLAAAAICFHLSHLPLALGLLAGLGLAWLRRDWRSLIHPRLACLPLALALFALFGFSLAAYHQLSLTPKSPPHLLARLIADGPGRAYLRDHCPERHYEICRFLDQLPGTEDAILWGFLPSVVGTIDGARLRAEQGAIVAGTIREFPGATLWNAMSATARQFVGIGSEPEFNDAGWQGLRRSGSFLAQPPEGTLQARRALAGPALTALNRLHAAIALASLLACLALARTGLRLRADRAVLLIGAVLLALVLNAFATGALGGVFSRYQGRIVWLLPFAALAARDVLARAKALGRS